MGDKIYALISEYALGMEIGRGEDGKEREGRRVGTNNTSAIERWAINLNNA